jgi:hypothetical protein
MHSSPRKRILRALGPILLLFLVVDLAGCGALRARRGQPDESGFLRDYSQLKPKDGYDAQLVYINPRAMWSRYDSVQLDAVTLWVNEDQGKLSTQEKQMLTDILYKALYDQLGKAFVMVEEPGPNVLRFRAALTQAKGANVPLNTMTTVVPQLRVATMAVGLTADTATTVGSATLEAEVLDSITNQRLGAVVDQRAGNKSLGTLLKKWGDVQKACEFWAQQVTFALLRMGVKRKS